MENKYLNVGYILKTRGLKGVLKVKSSTHYAAIRYKKGNKLYIYDPKTDSRTEVFALTYSAEGEFDYVSFKDLEDINLVEKFIGCTIQVNRDEIPPLPKGEFYYCDLEGLKCIDAETGKEFGVVTKIEEFTYRPSFRIKLTKDEEKTVLIPYVDAFVKKIDLDAKSITFKLIPGMID